MKKILNMALLLGICAFTTNAALADGMVFDPIDYPETPATIDTVTTPKAKAGTTLNTSVTKEVISQGDDNFENALLQLDTAQVEIRNSLLEYKTKYTEVDNQYKLIKNERKILAKQVKDIEKKIKEIEKNKNNIRKIME